VANKAVFCGCSTTLGDRSRLRYNLRFEFSIEKKKTMEAERINALSALLADLTSREAELRRYL
jgi:peptide chain release factor 2